VTRNLALALAAGAAAFALIGAAQLPSGLAQAQPGLWEISGLPGTAVPVRQCFADMGQLARFEHRAKNCSLSTVHDAGATGEVDYSCGPAGFGHSQVTLLTPRALRIATQGISDGLPFNYVLQARRVAECAPAPRH
jgi:hypothetical protein